MTYAEAGVSLDAADEVVSRLQKAVASTKTPRVLSGLGGFAGLLSAEGYRDPVLATGTDGVGTKLLLQRELGRFHEAGIDLVGMCVNDVLTCGAEPLLFLDYVAVGKLDPERVALLVEGIADGCRQSGAALLGGETAELADLYAPDDFDLAGFALGVVERDAVVDGSNVSVGDAVVGIPSSGVHSNGFTLVRRLMERASIGVTDAPAGLLAPTRIYAPEVKALQAAVSVRAMAHITGGGVDGNLPRVLPAGLGASLDEELWERPAVFDWLAGLGVEHDEMRRVFNMGLGFLAIVASGDVAAALAAVPDSRVVGQVVVGSGVAYRG